MWRSAHSSRLSNFTMSLFKTYVQLLPTILVELECKATSRQIHASRPGIRSAVPDCSWWWWWCWCCRWWYHSYISVRCVKFDENASVSHLCICTYVEQIISKSSSHRCTLQYWHTVKYSPKNAAAARLIFRYSIPRTYSSTYYRAPPQPNDRRQNWSFCR